MLAAGSSDVQLTWIRALADMGMEVLPATNEVDELVKNAQSIFEFEAKDIDGNPVSLNRYRYWYSLSTYCATSVAHSQSGT